MPFTASIRRQCARCCDQYQCESCNVTFLTACSLIQHLKNVKHKNQKYTIFHCTICNSRFTSKLGYIDHLKQKSIHKYDLHQAACCGRYQDVASLIHTEYANQTGGSHKMNATNELVYQVGATPMHCAAFRGYSRCLRLMLSWKDGDPNVQDDHDHQTPVHVAAKCGRATTLKLLLAKGGRLDVKDSNGHTPINLATENCENVILDYQIDRIIERYISMEISPVHEIPDNSQNCGEESNDDQINIASGGSYDHSSVSLSASVGGGDDKDDMACSAVVDSSVDTPENSQSYEEQSNEVREIVRSISRDRSAAVTLANLHENDNAQQIHQGSSEGQSSSDIQEVPSDLLPYEIIARGEKAVDAFKTALSEGMAPASRLRLSVVGEIGAGKTCLTRSLSGLPYKEDRERTHGIKTSMISEPMVNNTELNVSWCLADPKESHFDELVAAVVSKNLEEFSESPEQPQLGCETSSSPETQIVQPQIDYPGLFPPGKSSNTRIAADPRIAVDGTPRKLPATRIAKKLRQKKFEPSSVKVSIWDFAGHQLYETMHHVFMNNRSLYLVVFSLVKMEKKIDKSLATIHYWLNSIASHTSSTTPIIIVATHKDQVNPEVITTANELCKKHFDNAFGSRLVRNDTDEIVFAVNNCQGQKDDGITHLIEMIKKEAQSTLPFVTEKFPLKWLHCEEELVSYQKEPQSKKCMNLQELKELLETKCKVTFAEKEFFSMLTFFHDNGLILVPDVMCNIETSPSIKDLVVLSTQFLVDVMTSVHDARDDHSLKRQFSDEFKKLKEEGRADGCLLDHAWRNHEKKEVLVDLLSHFNLLHPLLIDLDQQAECSASTRRREFIIPCMLKDKPNESIEKKYKKCCDNWRDLCDTENILIFDFGRFLPPPLFDYLLVSIYRYSKAKGMKPYVRKSGACFSFSNKFIFRISLELQHSQIWVVARRKNGSHFLELVTILVEQMNQICQQYFKFLKFIYGPPCPLKECPGAEFHADDIQRPCESSSSGSESSEEEESAQVAPSPSNERRPHIIRMNYCSFDPPYWCSRMQIEENDLKDWDSSSIADEDLSQSFEEISTNPKEMCVNECCLHAVAKELGNDWKDIGRELGVLATTIENIDSDQGKQKEKCYQILASWYQLNGSDATKQKMSEVLEKCARMDLVGKFEEHWREKHE